MLLLALLCVIAPAARAQASPFEQLTHQADAARESGDLRNAAGLYREALALQPTWADGWWYLGSLSYGADDYSTAREALTRYLALKPSAAPALALRGLSEYELADYTPALADLEQALARGAGNQPRNEQLLRLHEALLLTRAGQFERALQDWLALARQAGAPPVATLGLGLAGLRIAALPAQLTADQQEVALAAGQAALQLTATPPLEVEGAATVADRGTTAAQRAGFEALFAHSPRTPNAHYFYAYLLFAGEPDRAVKAFQDELALQSASAPAAAMLAWAALMRSEPAAAVSYGRQAVSNDAGLPLAQLTLGRALVETGALSDGIAHLEQARRIEPANLEAHLALARAYSSAGRPGPAREERLLCLKLTQDSRLPEDHATQ